MNWKSKPLLKIGLSAIAAVWILALGWIAVDRFQLRRADAFQAAAVRPSQSGPLPVLWKTPAFSALDQNGHVVTEKALDQHVWIADFIFTRCTTACPLISAKMLLLRKAITSGGIRFVSFSVDPEFDTPAVLRDYARRWQGDARWLLLSTKKPSDVQQIAQGMKVPLERTRDPDNPILHTTFFFLVDPTGRLRGIYDSLDEDAVKRLVTDARKLDVGSDSRSMEPAPSNAVATGSPLERGHALFDSVGCAACHSDVHVAPPLAGVFGRSVRLEGGGTAMADDGYLRESIVDPGARVVAGYGPLMPSYRDHLSDGQVADVLAYLHSMAAPAQGAAAGSPGPAESATPALAAAQSPGPMQPAGSQTPAPGQPPAAGTEQASDVKAIDPVCGMQVHVAEAMAHTEYKGKTYYFCSETCFARFSKAPDKYVPGN